jgi:hypothetical protein
MRITNTTNPTPPSIENTPAPTPRPEGAGAGVPSASLSTQSSGLVPSFELLHLHDALRQLPSVRVDAVASAVGRLASDQLRTPAALDQTADAMLQG